MPEPSDLPFHTTNILLYQTEDGSFRLDVPTDGDTVWLTQPQMAELFGKARPTIIGHIQNIFEEGELQEEVVCRDFRHTTSHGAIEGKTQSKNVRHYNLVKWGQRNDSYTPCAVPLSTPISPIYFFTATTEISTRSSARAIRASTQARAGACPSGTQASHTSFMAAKSFISRT